VSEIFTCTRLQLPVFIRPLFCHSCPTLREGHQQRIHIYLKAFERLAVVTNRVQSLVSNRANATRRNWIVPSVFWAVLRPLCQGQSSQLELQTFSLEIASLHQQISVKMFLRRYLSCVIEGADHGRTHIVGPCSKPWWNFNIGIINGRTCQKTIDDNHTTNNDNCATSQARTFAARVLFADSNISHVTDRRSPWCENFKTRCAIIDSKLSVGKAGLHAGIVTPTAAELLRAIAAACWHTFYTTSMENDEL